MMKTMPIRKPHINARKLRRNMPPAEQRLWYFIRNRQLSNFRIRRQHSIGPYIADFACTQARLVIELDGDQHALGTASARDAKRDAFMESDGWMVLRFWNRDIYENIDGVLESILDACENSKRAIEIEKPAPPEKN